VNEENVTEGRGPSHDEEEAVDLVHRHRRTNESVILSSLFLAGSSAVVFTILIIFTLLDGSVDFFSAPGVSGFEFFTGTSWVPSGTNPRYGVLPLLAGTFLVAGGSLLIAGPIGIGGALYLAEFATKPTRRRIKPVVELLAGIPSIVYGFFALLVISPFLREHFDASYFNAMSAIIVMSVMILPIIVSISDDALCSVPRHMREAARGLGATRWETSTKVVLPAASSGVIASILLGLARAIGETMVVTLAAGSVARWSFDPMGETQTMTSYIAQVATGDIPPGTAVDAAFAVGLLLFVITYVINSIAMSVVKRIQLGSGPQRSTRVGKALDRVGAMLVDRIRRGDAPGSFNGPINSSFNGPINSSFNGSFNGPINSPINSPINDEKVDCDIVHSSPRVSAIICGIDDGETDPFEVTPITENRYRLERVGKWVAAGCLGFGVAFLALLLQSLLAQGLPGLTGTFLTEFPSYRPERAGIYPVIIGSLYLMLVTLLFAVPMGIGGATYLNEFARDTSTTRFLRRTIQNLAGVPSIVFGLVGLAIFARALDLGPSVLTGGLTLGIMVMPTIVVTTEEALKAVPQGFRDAALGLGATRWETVRHHVLPNALPGIVTGAVLSLSRAIGETAPILFIASIFSKTTPSSFMDGFLALPTTIFYWTRHPKQVFQDLAATTILVLLGLLMIMNAVAIVIRNHYESKREW